MMGVFSEWRFIPHRRLFFPDIELHAMLYLRRFFSVSLLSVQMQKTGLKNTYVSFQ